MARQLFLKPYNESAARKSGATSCTRGGYSTETRQRLLFVRTSPSPAGSLATVRTSRIALTACTFETNSSPAGGDLDQHCGNHSRPRRVVRDRWPRSQAGPEVAGAFVSPRPPTRSYPITHGPARIAGWGTFHVARSTRLSQRLALKSHSVHWRAAYARPVRSRRLRARPSANPTGHTAG
jgi:hypothetical protein